MATWSGLSLLSILSTQWLAKRTQSSTMVWIYLLKRGLTKTKGPTSWKFSTEPILARIKSTSKPISSTIPITPTWSRKSSIPKMLTPCFVWSKTQIKSNSTTKTAMNIISNFLLRRTIIKSLCWTSRFASKKTK